MRAYRGNPQPWRKLTAYSAQKYRKVFVRYHMRLIEYYRTKREGYIPW